MPLWLPVPCPISTGSSARTLAPCCPGGIPGPGCRESTMASRVFMGNSSATYGFSWIFQCNLAFSWPMHRLPLPSGFAAPKPHQVLALEGLSAPVESPYTKARQPSPYHGTSGFSHLVVIDEFPIVIELWNQSQWKWCL